MSSPFTLTLTPDQRADFERDGVLVLPGYFPTADMNAMADALWADLFRRFAIDRRRPETWTIERPGKFQPLIRAGAFRAFGSERLMAIGDAFLGAGRWQKPRWLGYPLVTFPTAGVGRAASPMAFGHFRFAVSEAAALYPRLHLPRGVAADGRRHALCRRLASPRAQHRGAHA